MQAFGNYRKGCDLLDYKNYDWYDVGVSAAVGAIAPGWFSVGKKSWTSGRAIATLTEQLGRAQTANRAAKVASRITDHTQGVADLLLPQLGFQGIKQIGKEVTDGGGSNDCKCQQ